MSDRAAIIICTHPGSKRIPQKCFQIINGRPALDHLLCRIKGMGLQIVLAIPEGTEHIYRGKLNELNGVIFYHGSGDSPLHRMAGAITHLSKTSASPDYVIRITHDDILIDQATIWELLIHCRSRKLGYGITPNIIEGAGVECIAAENILFAADNHEYPVEHISYYVKGNSCPNPTEDRVHVRSSIRRRYRLSMDYPEDVVVLEAVLRKCGNYATLDSICEYLDLNSYLLAYNHLPEITVYTCAHNAEKYINQTILNVLRIPYDLEYIVIDDNSTDETLNEILKYTSLNNDRRLKVLVNEKNIGLAASCNRALSIARGKYIMRIDADDMVYPHAFCTMLNEIKIMKAAICYAAYHELSESGKIGKEIIYGDVHHHAGCALFDTRLLNQIRFTEGLRHWDSLDLYNRIKDKFNIAYVREPLWIYRQHPDSMSKSKSAERRKTLEKINAAK